MYFISSDHRDQIFMRSNLQFVDVCSSFQCIKNYFACSVSPGRVEADVG